MSAALEIESNRLFHKDDYELVRSSFFSFASSQPGGVLVVSL